MTLHNKYVFFYVMRGYSYDHVSDIVIDFLVRLYTVA